MEISQNLYAIFHELQVSAEDAERIQRHLRYSLKHYVARLHELPKWDERSGEVADLCIKINAINGTLCLLDSLTESYIAADLVREEITEWKKTRKGNQ